jgi:hypothetical protein
MFLLWKHRFGYTKYLTADNSVFQYSNANDMRVTQDLNSFGEIIAHAQCSINEKYIYIPCVPHKNNCNNKIGGTFTKLFMHVSSRNMFPTTRNMQIRVHVYRPRHYCGD